MATTTSRSRSLPKGCLGRVIGLLPCLLLVACAGPTVSGDPTPSPGAPAAEITVTYAHPEKFRDFGRTDREREENIRLLTRHLQTLGARLLPPGGKLQVAFDDIDLAGEVEPWHFRGEDIRVLRSVTWPRLDLHYHLEQPGAAPREGKAQLNDPAYLDRVNPYFQGESLRYEKALLDEWLRGLVQTRGE